MNRKRFMRWISIGMLFILAACQAAGQPLSAAMVGSGGTISGMGLTTGLMDAPPLWGFCSIAQAGTHLKAFDCRAPVMPTLAIGHIFLFGDEVLANLEWSNLVWELSIDDQPVDLESFGTYEYIMPRLAMNPSPVREVFQKVTAWNVVLTNLNPGEHRLRFLAQTETDSYTWFVNLVIEGEEGVDMNAALFALKS